MLPTTMSPDMPTVASNDRAGERPPSCMKSIWNQHESLKTTRMKLTAHISDNPNATAGILDEKHTSRNHRSYDMLSLEAFSN